jgi:sec-independent protein translocase protein TatA
MSLHLLAFLGGQEIIILLVIVIILFGAKKLPKLARGLGQAQGEFKKARMEMKNEIDKAQEDSTEDS